MSLHIIPHQHKIQKEDRIKLNGHKSMVLWFAGLSGSGKSTLASALEQRLYEAGYHTYILDGDNIRTGLNKGLTFNDGDRKENIRRIAEVSKLFVDAGVIVLTAFISPFREDRAMARQLIGEEFTEVYVDCPIEVCEQRDVKGLYKKARAGEIQHFTGIDSPFESPENPEISVPTYQQTLAESVEQMFQYVISKVQLNTEK
jgi:adenylylsulfate kinase